MTAFTVTGNSASGNSPRNSGTSFTLAMDGSAKRITATSTPIHRLEITGTTPFYWGYDSSISHLTNRGCRFIPNGLAQIINIDNLNKIYFIATSGDVCGNYLS